MRRILMVSLLAVGSPLAVASEASAQVFVRAPFVRVEVGPGVAVRAPFVNLWVPSRTVYAYPPPIYAPPAGYVFPPQQGGQPNLPATPPIETGPLPKPIGEANPPPPTLTEKAPTLEQFVKSFQPKAGYYDVELLNPVTNQPTRVRFTLPEGTPKKVEVRQNEIEFRYGVFRFVRIEFDKDGAQVISR